ncbi:MAG: YbcC family protein [Saprospiraceae bacterium]
MTLQRTKTGFDEAALLHDLKHYLPTQTPIKDFIHHNTLHAFQDRKFYDAIFRASKIFSYQVTLELDDYRGLFRQGRIREDVLQRILEERKGANPEVQELWAYRLMHKTYDLHIEPRIGRVRANWKKAYRLNLDNLVQPLLFRIVGSYLDQGIAIRHFPKVDQGFLEALRDLERNSFSSFLKTGRARKLLLDDQCSIESLLDILVGDERFYEEYLFDQQFNHHGWSGMVATVEDLPHTLLYPKKISLRDFILFELILEIDALEAELGRHWKPLCQTVTLEHEGLFDPVPLTELQEVFIIWQDAFEWSYYDEVLTGLSLSAAQAKEKTAPAFQAVFCIDERECSLRRHIEYVVPECETLGAPGFFGVEFYFLPENGKFYEKLCPAPVTPRYLVKEEEARGVKKHERLYSKHAHKAFGGFFYALFFGFWAGIKLALDLFRPKMSPAISNAFGHMDQHSRLIIENTDPADQENGLQIGFTLSEMADRVEGLLRNTGLIQNFAPLVYLISHGSSSANNPHHGAHDCGACSGRPGATNSRVFCMMANHPKVRELLAGRGLAIPDQTQFVPAMHDTASDRMGYYDEDVLTPANRQRHDAVRQQFEQALDLNAKERSRRFASIDTDQDIRKVRRAIEARSVSFFEPRPELGHGTNALCIVGRRALTKALFLDRRAFMNSYDYRTDPEGKLLLGVIKPLPVVCGGINLEYYFSRVDNQKFGAGTKLPHNVTGLIGVTNSSDGDLRPGLPLQMIEVHDPIRLLMLVEHYPDVVLKTIQTLPELYEWFENEWVHLMAMEPETGAFYYFKDHAFHRYAPKTHTVPEIEDLHRFFEEAKPMETNHILDATKENLPVHLLK